MATRQYFDFQGVDKKGKPISGTAVVVGGRELDEAEAVAHIQRTNFPKKGAHTIKSAQSIDSSDDRKKRELNAPPRVKNIFHMMEEAEKAAQARAVEAARRQEEAMLAEQQAAKKDEVPRSTNPDGGNAEE
jgi:hypothetical protein